MYEHGITTIYDELACLKTNNDVIDLTRKNIYDNLDFNDWEKDISIIHNAECNIGVGEGGQFVNCICFSKYTAFYTDLCALDSLNKEHLNNQKIFTYCILDNFINNISNYLTNYNL